mgnify:FL=1|jgi:monoamine oxidase
MTRATPHVAGAQPVDVVIVGAGFAGLAAAYALTSAGKVVKCLEARDRVGGRAVSLPAGQGAVDLGASWIWPGELAVQSFTERLGVPLHPQSTAGNALLDRGDVPEQLAGNPIDVPASRFSAGTADLASRMSAALPPGTVDLGQPVTAIAADETGVRVSTPTRTYEAQHVIIAVPPALAVASIDFTPALPTDVRQAAEETAVWMGQAVKAVAVYDDAFWRTDGLSGSAVSYRGPFTEFHDHSGGHGDPAAIFGFASAERFRGASTTAISEAFILQLQRLFGPRAATPLQVHVCDWSREPYTSPIMPSPRASTRNFGHPIFQRPAQGGRLTWASTETATEYAGHLEGAVRAGLQAASRLSGR